MTQKDEMIFGLCYGDCYNRFPTLELWDEEKRRKLPQATKDKVVEYLKNLYAYYVNKYKDWTPIAVSK